VFLNRAPLRQIGDLKKTVTLDPLEKARVEPYASQGLKAYADTLTKTLNTWAEMEGSEYCVCAEGGTDDKTGLAMLTLRLSRAEAAYRQKSLHRDLMNALKVFHLNASKKEGSMVYQRDILFFQKNRLHIIRPNILLNWTRTSALNDAARIYGEIMLAAEESILADIPSAFCLSPDFFQHQAGPAQLSHFSESHVNRFRRHVGFHFITLLTA